MDHTPGAGKSITVITEQSMWTHFEGLRTKLLLTTFYDFLIRHFKNRKRSCFLKSEKNVKYVFSNSGVKLQTDNHASIPSLSFSRAACSSWCPTNSVKGTEASTRKATQFWILMKQEVMKWQWQTICASLQTDNCTSTSSLKYFMGWMLFQLPNQQCQSTESTNSLQINYIILPSVLWRCWLGTGRASSL